MERFCEPFAGKKITVMGLGLLGRGVGDAEFFAKCGAQVVVTDKKSEAELAESVAKLRQYPNIAFHLGGHRLEDFTNVDLVIKAAGVPLDSPEIAAARKADVLVAMSTALFAKYAMEAGAIIVGITGTRGKSTTTQMIYHSLKTAGRNVMLGGNVRGVSTLAQLPKVREGMICVLELDSWQLQGFGDLQMSPHVAVFTNLMPDHQNYYPSMETYFNDKANIFRYQKEGDFLFVGEQVRGLVEAARPKVAPHVPPAISTDWELQVIGDHNSINASLAAAALNALGLSAEEIKRGLESFQAVEGRLQFVREVEGVEIYNDNNATTPEATIAALRAVSEHYGFRKSVILITGGSDKGLDLSGFVQEIKQSVAKAIVLTHPNYKGSERLMSELKAAGVSFEEAASLQGAVEKGMKGIEAGNGALLFSPAFASFGMFKNEYDRNDQFMAIVKSL